MALRLYEFRVNGFIPGVPGEFAGGTQALIDDESNQVIAWGPLGQPLKIPLDDPPPQEQPAQVEQPPAPVDPLADAMQKLGG